MNFLQKIIQLFTKDQTVKVEPQPAFGNTLQLQQQQPYKVIKEFIDYDKQVHPIGETWIYKGTAFLPYEDGLSLFVSKNDSLIMYRLQWRKEEQADIIDNFKDFVEPC
jgi:hypothetical protein